MNSFDRFFAAAATVAALVTVTPSVAAPILDQSFDAFGFSGGNDNTQIIPSQILGQTFTVGFSGRLSGVTVQVLSVDARDDLYWDILPTVSGAPQRSATPIVSGTIPLSDIPLLTASNRPIVNIDLTPFNLMVHTGDVLALVLRNPAPGAYAWIGSTNDPYPNGAGFFRASATGNWTEVTTIINGIPVGIDRGFTTFVDPDRGQTIPEPGTLALIEVGLVGFAFVGRGRRR